MSDTVAPTPTGTGPWLYEATVAHARTAPATHRFSYALRPWLVDLDTLDDRGHPYSLAPALRPLASFRAADHFDGSAPTLRAAVDAWCAAHDLARPARVLTLAQPRAFGYVFNPISVHWLYDDTGLVTLVLAEVHNTYSGRHVYPVHLDADHRASVDKTFPVSPFFTTAGTYEMRVSDPGERVHVAMTLALPAAVTDPVTGRAEPAADPERATRPFTASLRGRRIPVTTAAVLVTAVRHTWPSLRTSVLIYRHGIALWLSGRRRGGTLPVQPHPDKSSWEGVR
ncbi:MAG: DUF1365 domain-containing protein [Mycobacteriaceae bacterium]